MGWSVEGQLIYYNLKEQLIELRKIKQASTDKYLMKFCSGAGVKASRYFNSGKEHKVQENDGNDKCKWSKLLKEKETAYARGYRTVLFLPAVVDINGHGPMGI